MNRGIIITLIVTALAVGSGVYGYRNYQENQKRELAIRRDVFEKAEKERRARDEQKRIDAEAEARRLVEARDAADAKAAADEQERKRLAQAEADSLQLLSEKAEQEAKTARELVALENQKAAKQARLEQERRERASAEAETARVAALNEIARVEREKKAAADRETARLAALQRQQELEAAEAARVPVITRAIYPSDYKRREHYYLDVEMKNSENAKPPTRPKPASQATAP